MFGVGAGIAIGIAIAIAATHHRNQKSNEIA